MPLTSVHTKETTTPIELAPSYREYRINFDQDEYTFTTLLYSGLDVIESRERSSQLESCRTWAWFAREKKTNNVIVLSNACRLRWCPLCSKGKSSYMEHQIPPWLETVIDPKFLTLTLKHSNSPLQQQVDHLYKSFRTLRENKQMKPYLHGGIWFFQIKYIKETEQWHPHLHIILDSKFIPQKWLSKLWSRITKGSNIVDIRRVWKPSVVSQYIARYAARPAMLKDVPIGRHQELYFAMHGRRLCGAWGTAKDVKLSSSRLDDRSKFEKLGSWNTVMNCKMSISECRAIYEAWKDHNELDPEISAMSLEPDYYEPPPKVDIDISNTESQPQLPFR